MELAPEPLWEQGSLTGMADVTVERVVSEKVETNMPDAPVAGPALTSSGFSAPVPEHAEVEDFSSEPLAERLHARDLARRCSAYAELQAKMDAGNADTELWALCGASVDMALAESLPKGQDAALNAVAAYLKHCPGLEAKTVLPWVRKLTEHKAIDKPKMQQLAPSVVLLIAEIAECPAVLQELTNCLNELDDSKKKSTGFLKKQIAFIIKLISQLLGDFGIKKMPPKLGYLSFVLKYVSDSDRGIREACYSVAIEMAAWLGDIGDLISPMDEPQKKEVAKRLEAAGGEQKSKPIRCYRGDAAAQHGDGARSSSKPAEKADDLFEKVDPFKKLPKGWCISAVPSMEKWKEKLQHLQVLSGVLEGPAERHLLAPHEGYGALVPTIQRMLKSESNIPLLTEVAKCMGLLASGLKKHFEKFARQLLPVALGRINDKSVWKPNCLVERVEQLLWSVPLEGLLEELPQHISSKSLFVKKEALNLLMRALELPQVLEVHPDAAQRFFAASSTLTLPLIDDSDHLVRQEAAKALSKLITQNPEAAFTVLDRVPPHRRAVFEEEHRKLCKEPLPERPGERPGTPTPLSPPLRRSPLKQRLHAVPVDSPLPLTATEKPISEKAEKEEQVRSLVPKAEGKENQQLPEVKESKDEAKKTDVPIETTPLIKQMAEEIRNLRSKVKQLEMDKERERSEKAEPRLEPVDTPSPGPQLDGARLARRAASAEGRDATPTRPTRLRQQHTPTRRESPLRRELRDATPPRRALVPVARPPPSLAPRREPSPLLRREPSPLTRREPSPLTRREPTPTRTRREPTPRRDGSVSRDMQLAVTPRHASPSRRPISYTPSYLMQDGDSMLGESVVPFQIALPRLPKQARQQKEKSQYWGPETIPSDHLSALREQWRSCVEEWLWRQMFSDRLEEQLAGLSHWQKQAEDYGHLILEADVLDMVLKWLTWMLWHANTKVWKSILDVLLALLRTLESHDLALTDRETQILVPNIVERSGHNILAIRETMQELLRFCSILAPRTKMLPMILHGLCSKSKRSAACSMKALGEMLDRQTTLSLLRSQKDLGLVLKLTVDKDPEVRRCSVQTVALLSLHLDDDVFVKVCRGLPPLAKGPVQQAAFSLQELQDDRP
ncbi:Protein MOR1 (Protein GEM1) (Protein MICROTUBULE ORGANIZATION 1) [Durusdinium trenchii]|uniref:Protein MOR1 (Protein GEM1) (Protein MICROTUBULE ORGANIZATION 1) n=2 Tax=Durusdinium trenchii TaxID=1381693 RepID=A0ABP0QDV8_9DINO